MDKNKITVIKDAIENGNIHSEKIFLYFKEFINFLNRENILYFLSMGTLLGCIRDKKKIPWDDDYDIYINNEEIKKLKNYSEVLSHEEIVDNMLYKIKLGENMYYIKKNECSFKHLFVNDAKTVCDIFNENDGWYNRLNYKPTQPIIKLFEGIKCNVNKYYHHELIFFYGENYMNEYVVSNHKIASCYRDRDKCNRIILTKEEFNKIIEDMSI
jgi:hypothetical protein